MLANLQNRNASEDDERGFAALDGVTAAFTHGGIEHPESAQYLRGLADATATTLLIVDSDGNVLYANRAAYQLAELLTERQPGDAPLTTIRDWHPDLLPDRAILHARAHGAWIGEVMLQTAVRQLLVVRVQVTPIRREGVDEALGVMLRDFTEEYSRANELRQRNAELEIAYTQLKGAQEQLVQNEKLASIGQLAAGVAHEINNPIGYVNSNLSTLQNYVAHLVGLVATYSEALQRTGNRGVIDEIDEVRARLDYDFISHDLPLLLSESREGIDRVCKIVQDLKDFSRSDRGEAWVRADLHRGLDSTLNIVWNELKYKAQIVKTFGDLPQVECLPNELNQVFMNILVNAGQAIKDHGVITVSTGVEGDKVWIAIGDDGEGIPDALLQRIFDPFFTTKPVGTGTGLGLAISYGIVAKHQGSIGVTSTPGQGTLFRIELPVNQPLKP